MPGAVINEETVIEHIGPVAIVHLVPDQIGQAHLPVTHFRKWQGKPALPLIAGVIDNHGISAAIVAGPGEGDEAVRAQIARPSRLGVDLGPVAFRKAVLVFKTCSNLV